MDGRRPRCAPLALAMALGGCAWIPPLPAPRLHEPWGVHRIGAREIREASGLVASRTHEGVLWTHNDSGDRPRLFAIGREGRLLGEYPVEGAQNVDWEDIAIDDSRHLYLGDFGNNRNDRRDLAVYRVPEPDPLAPPRALRADRVLRFRYADQRAFPDPKRRNFDAEAMLWLEGALYLFTKHRSDTRTAIYRLPDDAAEPLDLEPLAEIDLGGERSGWFGNTTAADITPDGRFVALLTYRAILLYERHGPHPIPDGPTARIALDPRRTRQVESIAWDGGALVVGNEQRMLFRIPAPFAPALDRYPPRGGSVAPPAASER